MNFLADFATVFALSLATAPALTSGMVIVLNGLVTYAVWRPLGERRRLPLALAGGALTLGALDWLLLSMLPRLGLSFGSVSFGLLMVSLARLLIMLLLALPIISIGRTRPELRSPRVITTGLASFILVSLAIVGGEFYALYIEPFALQTSHVAVNGPALLPDRPLRIVHLSDTHIEYITQRERTMLDTIDILQPDLILLTGDYINLDFLNDPQAQQDTRSVLSQLHAPYGVYAVRGTVDTSRATEKVFSGLPITLLQDEVQRLDLGAAGLYLVGISNLEASRDAQALEQAMSTIPADAYTILLYHTPDLIGTAAAQGVDLYLAGHTHGGQIRLPWYGAIVTFSAYGKQYEAGRYTLGPTTLYVSRGIGMEGFAFPRVRFLCPPEVVEIKISP